MERGERKGVEEKPPIPPFFFHRTPSFRSIRLFSRKTDFPSSHILQHIADEKEFPENPKERFHAETPRKRSFGKGALGLQPLLLYHSEEEEREHYHAADNIPVVHAKCLRDGDLSIVAHF